jgi:uncharacterized membrane protein
MPRAAIRAAMAATILSLLMLAGLALLAGGIYLIGKKRDPKRGWLMITAAIVMFANVAIWAMPTG